MAGNDDSLDENKVALSLREELLELDQRRKATMNDVEEALSFLSTTPAGMHAPLVDKEGFPRDDCDLYAVRRARHTVNCGRNDIRDIEQRMHEKLSEMHESRRDEAFEQMERDAAAHDAEKVSSKDKRTNLAAQMARQTPFLRVTHVERGSPAERGGMTAGHLIVRFGDVGAEEMAARGNAAVVHATKSREGQMLSVWVLDEEQQATELFVVPQRWSGEGLLGSGFEPVRSSLSQ